MASTPRTPRRGLPRVPGGEPWPPAASAAPVASGAPEDVEDSVVDASSLAAGTPRTAGSEANGREAAPPSAQASHTGADPADATRNAAIIGSFSEDARADATDATYARTDATDATALPAAAPHPVADSHPGPAPDPIAAHGTDASPAAATVRRGLPREPGGEPWPPAPPAVADSASGGPAPTPAVADPASTGPTLTAASSTVADTGPFVPAPAAASSAVAESDDGIRTEGSAGSVAASVAREEPAAGSGSAAAPALPDADHPRRGLPREPGGQPWPPAHESGAPSPRPAAAVDASLPGAAASTSSRVADGSPSEVAASGSPRDADGPPPEVAASGSRPASAAPPVAASPPPEATTPIDAAPSDPPSQDAPTAPRAPLTVRRTVWPGAAASAERPSRTEPKRVGPFTPLQWLGSTAVLGVFALALAGITVLVARFLLALGPGQEFLAAYPGEYHLPDSAPVGIPAWLNWSHFLNSFFLLFIIRTGWQVRGEKRPAAFWSPRKNKRRRISLTLWFHQAVDILWIANGVIFVVLLVVTGQWMRIVPTSWEVFPNALSAALQYVSLDWPTENGWVNYNSLQQLSYFAITFLAAPLAIVSGVRLSGVWPKDAERLNRLYPVEWARKVHFPVMLFFVAFIVVHVALVLATGALRNLNHMYAARGSVDPDAFTSDPTGLLIFAASLLVMAVGWAAARPRVLVPIARLFGDVKQR